MYFPIKLDKRFVIVEITNAESKLTLQPRQVREGISQMEGKTN